MMENKKYYWIRLLDNFFSDEILHLRKCENGDTYTIIYIKLCLYAINNDGYILHKGYQDNFLSEIATALQEPIETVTFALGYLKKLNLVIECGIDEKGNPVLHVPYTLINSGETTKAAIAKRKQRARRKLESEGVVLKQLSHPEGYNLSEVEEVEEQIKEDQPENEIVTSSHYGIYKNIELDRKVYEELDRTVYDLESIINKISRFLYAKKQQDPNYRISNIIQYINAAAKDEGQLLSSGMLNKKQTEEAAKKAKKEAEKNLTQIIEQEKAEKANDRKEYTEKLCNALNISEEEYYTNPSKYIQEYFSLTLNRNTV